MYPGVHEALVHLAARGRAMAVCTSNRSDYAERILQLFGISEYFDFVSGGDIGIRKTTRTRSSPEGTIELRDL